MTPRIIALAGLGCVGLVILILGYLAIISDAPTRGTIVVALIAMGSSTLSVLMVAAAHALGYNTGVGNGNGVHA